MRRIKRGVGAALAVFAAMVPGLALAQWNGVPGVPATAGALAPPEILAQVRRAGFAPMSRPVQRGRVYVLFAVDPYDMDVKLTVDAGSGRVLWVTDATGPRYGGAGYYSNPPLSRYDRPPIPPSDIPHMGPGTNNSGLARSSASTRPPPPLPRTRPADLTSAAAKETVPPTRYTSPRTEERRESSEPKAAAPVRSDVAPAAKPPPVTMVPVAPLE
jgi:hypothetical protein